MRKPVSTDLQLKHLKPEDKPYDVTIAHVVGLYVTVGKKSKTFKWDRGTGHKPRKMIYGHFPALSIKQAREAHEKTQIEHQSGTLGMTVNVPKTIAELAELFYQDRIVPKRKRPDAVRQVLDHDVIPEIGSLKLSAVNVLAVRKVVKAVVDRGATTHAGKVLSIMKQMFNFAVSLSFISTNPAASLDPDSLGIESNSRDRVLTDQEITVFWNALNQNKSPVTRVALQLLLLLGLRSSELRLAEWTHLDADNRTLTIPVANQKLSPKQLKNAKPFVVPLSDFAYDLLESLQGLDGVFIFVGKNKGKPLTDKVFGKTVARMLPGMGVGHFVPHDLRRTLRTRLSKLKVDYLVAEKCLNHSLGKIDKTYDQHDYLDERREALKLWGDEVQRITGNNVVQLRRSA